MNNYQRETKNCQNCKNQFTIEPEDFEFYTKVKVPPPTWCPECRMVRKMNVRNERTLYKNKCDLYNKNLISMYPNEFETTYSPDRPEIVYCEKCYNSEVV